MNQKIRLFLIVSGVIIVAFFSYYFFKNWNNDPKEERQHTETESREEVIKKELVNKYNALTEWGKDISYTYQLKKELIDSGKLILFTGYVEDIINKDGKYFIIFVTNILTKPQVIFNLECEENRVLDIVGNKNENDDLLSALGFGKYVVVAKIDKVEKIRLKIDGSSYDEEVEFEYSPGDTFIADGECIDFSYSGTEK